MADEAGRFGWLNKLSLVAMVVALVLAAVLLVGGVALTVNVASTIDGLRDLPNLIRSAVVIIWALLVAVLAVVGYGLMRLLVSNERNVRWAAEHVRRIETLSEEQHRQVQKLTDLSQLSDQAKALIFREREIEAFRETLHADLMKQDYRSAELLADALESRFGYSEEAAELREEIQESHDRTLDEKIDAAMSRIDSILARYDWNQAAREADRVLRLFPENDKVAALPDRIEEARNARKRELLQEYGEAVRKNDIDRSIQLLRELDLYLTPQEAAAMEESARGVFRAKLHNMGVQFAICVTDQRWAEAIEVGEQIVAGYPNSRMAQEVREKMDQLRSRAGLRG